MHAFHERAAELSISALPGVGLPLRPVILPRAQVERIAAGLVALAERSRQLLLDEGGAAFFVPAPFVDGTDFRASLAAPWALATMRPDGFLIDGTFHVTETNIGNGVLISAAYAATVHLLFDEFLWPFFERAGLERAGLVRSFDGLVDVLRPFGQRLAVLMPDVDCGGADTWGERVHQQL